MTLNVESLELALQELSVPDALVPELTQLVRAVSEDESVADRVEELVEGLTSQIDDVFNRESLFVPEDFMIGPGRGSVPLLALLKVRDAVDEYWQKRHYPEDIRRATVAEIGRQVEVTHSVEGWVGLTDAKWIEIVFRGGFAQVGRLQFELMHDEYRVDYGLNTHISAAGHLDMDAVRDSLTRGRALFARAFPEYGPITLAGCNSWLLDPQFGQLLPDSNIARFGRMWEPEDSGPGDGEVLFFVFGIPRGQGDRLHEIRPRLTATTRLQKVVLEHWDAGGHFRTHRGFHWIA